MIIWQQNVPGPKWKLFAKYAISHLTFILFERAAKVITHPVKSDVLCETTEPDNTDFIQKGEIILFLGWDAFPPLPIYHVESIIPCCTLCAVPGSEGLFSCAFPLMFRHRWLQTQGQNRDKIRLWKKVLVCCLSGGRQKQRTLYFIYNDSVKLDAHHPQWHPWKKLQWSLTEGLKPQLQHYWNWQLSCAFDHTHDNSRFSSEQNYPAHDTLISLWWTLTRQSVGL